MHYISTRGLAPKLNFTEAMLTGLASDGGLYWPESWPQWSREDWHKLAGRPYAEIALAIMRPFLNDEIDGKVLADILAKTYRGFRHPAVAPLRQLDYNLWQLELFHGPTWSFKDYALQLLGRLLERVLEERKQRVVIVGATSGDTGSAAIEACRGRAGIAVVMLHPLNRVSEIQRRQMTTVLDDNIHNIAVAGSFDDCQDMVKAMFADSDLRQRHNLSAVNSINWLRILAQMVYYAASGLSIGDGVRPFGVAVPTGNFGNILAAWSVRRMGLPIKELIIGSNKNDILTRFIQHNDMSLKAVIPTTAPAMDIQISSNFERYLFEIVGQDGEACRQIMQQFRQMGRMKVSEAQWKQAQSLFKAASYDDGAIARIIQDWYQRTGLLIEPHSAIAVQAAMDCRQDESLPIVAVASAHPAKFGDTMQQALGIAPDLPADLAAHLQKPEKCLNLPAKAEALKSYIMDMGGGI